MRLAGHRLTMEWSGEYGENSSSTGECSCGWTESGSSQKVVRQEYRWHLERLSAQQIPSRTPTSVVVVGDGAGSAEASGLSNPRSPG